MKKETVMFRQGDVLVRKVASIPKNLRPSTDKNAIILQYGEVTGHAHAIRTPEKVKGFIASDVDQTVTDALGEGKAAFLEVLEECQLTHEEHAPLTLSPGSWEVSRQSEYEPEAIRFVND
jgi:hypothetical protein